MSLVHSKEEALRIVQQMSDGMFKDGLLLDVPKRRLRQGAQGKRPLTIKLSPEHKMRWAKQFWSGGRTMIFAEPSQQKRRSKRRSTQRDS